jgi:hypothetical protein
MSTVPNPADAPVLVETPTPPKPIPEVRQCVDQEHWQFGSVAVKSSVPGLTWGIFSPANGGHWGEDEEVKDWKVLNANS